MSKECAVCKQEAAVVAHITQSGNDATVYLCENCAFRIGNQMPLEIIDSVSPNLPKGVLLTPQRQLWNQVSVVSSQEPNVCYRCGMTIPKGFKFCPECGTNVSSMYGNDLSVRGNAEIKYAGKKSKNKAIKILLSVFITALIVSLAGGVVWNITQNKFDVDEEYVLRIVSEYKNYLKNPDSLVLRGDILLITDSNHDKYVTFVASGTNGFGGIITSEIFYKGYIYLGEDTDDISDVDEYKAEDFLTAKKYVLTWNRSDEDMINKAGITHVQIIDGKKIARKVKCEYRDDGATYFLQPKGSKEFFYDGNPDIIKHTCCVEGCNNDGTCEFINVYGTKKYYCPYHLDTVLGIG